MVRREERSVQKEKKQGVNEQKMVRKGINDCHLESVKDEVKQICPQLESLYLH